MTTRIKHSLALIGRGIVEKDVEKLVQSFDDEIILYCGGGYRSVLSAFKLQKKCFINVVSMTGGIRLWRELKLPEET